MVDKLVSGYGLVSRSFRLGATEGDPRYPIFTASLGNPGEVLVNQKHWQHNPASGNFDGAGGSIDPAFALRLAVAESLERYSSCAWTEDALVWATEEELGDECISLSRWPRCSEREYVHPDSNLIAADPRIPLRWVKGWSVTRERSVYVPAVQVYLQFPALTASERFTHPVSTGCATHSSWESAVVSGLVEVVERDSISLTWLQQLRLPEIDISTFPSSAELDAYLAPQRASHIRTRFFDATTDFGIPVVYAVQLADHDPDLAQIVAATGCLSPVEGVKKLLRELASLRIALRSFTGDIAKYRAEENITDVIGGALRQGRLDRRGVMSFLLDQRQPPRDVSTMPAVGNKRPLAWMVDKLDAAGAEAIVVDLTTDEARECGMKVVKVLVPEAMPLSFAHRSRYLGHPRLYAAPAAMGMSVHDEDDINSEAQPFA
ncbi:YcaO-like family protein [Pengzhenrongella phosphoraccumulans]|uniref:YcaO-like family protein n=1 Tax=Pengzhenrongella phosphoraccumulans TaxID=3114394 RepID=UPI003890E688